jgi:integrase/recombinase XerD
MRPARRLRPNRKAEKENPPLLGDHQARKLLDAPDGNRSKLRREGRLSDADDSTRNERDRVILSTLLLHALRRERAVQAEGQGLPAPA